MGKIAHKIESKALNEWLDTLGVLRIIGYEKSNPKTFEGEIRDCCPIHRGNNPSSLSINKQKKWFKCHICNAKGSLIDLYGLSLGLDLKGDCPRILEELASLTHYHQDEKSFNSEVLRSIV